VTDSSGVFYIVNNIHTIINNITNIYKHLPEGGQMKVILSNVGH